MNKIITFSIVFISIFVFSSNVYGDYTSGNDFYEKYKGSKKEVDKMSFDNMMNSVYYRGYLEGFFIYCMAYDDNCNIPMKYTFDQVFDSFGLFLENNPDIRHYSIISLLKMWELYTFTDENDIDEIYEKSLQQFIKRE